jgi:hypothetical protein
VRELRHPLMDIHEFAIHIQAGRSYGRESACGDKVDYRSEAGAVSAAELMSAKHNRALEAYPCAWCTGWHIGRTMTAEERERFYREQFN